MIDESLYGKIHLPPESVESLRPHSIFLFEPATNPYENDEEKVGDRKVSAQLLKDLISHQDSLSFISKLFNNEISTFTVYFVSSEGEYRAQFGFNKKSFVEYLERIIFELTPAQEKIFFQLADKISYESLLKEKGNDIYSVNIEGTDYNFKVYDLLNFLQIDESEYMSYMFDDNGTYNDIPITHFLYAIINYLDKNYIESNYRFFGKIEKRIKEIRDSYYIDIEAINKITKSDDYNFNDIKVNEELKELILRDMPPYLSSLEKAIYIYIKMCKILTYDEEFYAVNQRGPVADRHEEVENVAKITPTNNRVVCYEFNAIYEKMIAELGLNFSTSQALLNGFGGGHASLKFRDGKFLVKADAVTSILRGDIMNAKLNQPLEGLRCLNKNQQTRREFYTSYKIVYDLIASQEKKLSNNEVDQEESFEDVLQSYIETTGNLRPVSIEEKFHVLITKVNNTQMIGIDALSYILQLRKVLFTEQEQKDFFRVSIIRENTPNEPQIARPRAIFALRIPGEDKYIIKYYAYYPNKPLVEISLDILQDKFASQEFEYIAKDDPRIPGVDGGPKI